MNTQNEKLRKIVGSKKRNESKKNTEGSILKASVSKKSLVSQSLLSEHSQLFSSQLVRNAKAKQQADLLRSQSFQSIKSNPMHLISTNNSNQINLKDFTNDMLDEHLMMQTN